MERTRRSQVVAVVISDDESELVESNWDKKVVQSMVTTKEVVLVDLNDVRGMKKLKAEVYQFYHFVYTMDREFTTFICCLYCSHLLSFKPKNGTTRHIYFNVVLPDILGLAKRKKRIEVV